MRLGPLPFLAILAFQLPYALVYLRNLWGLSHYQFYPLLIGAVGYLGYKRWTGESAGGANRGWSSAGLLLSSLLVAATAGLFASPWMGYLGLVLAVGGWLAVMRDRETGGSLLYLALPLLLIWQPPYSPQVAGDAYLISRLQQISARLSSSSLDLLGFLHNQPGTVLEFAGRSFGVEEACSGIQSFFTLLCFAALMMVYFRRPLLHSLAIIASSVFWAILMNTVRITAIPITFGILGIDISHGVLHQTLGFATMGMALAMLVSTDHLILAVIEWMGWNKPGEGELGKGTDRNIDFQENDESETGESRHGVTSLNGGHTVGHTVISHTKPWHWGVMSCFGVLFCLQAYDILGSLGQQKRAVTFFASDVLISLNESDGPSSIGNWPYANGSYIHEDRERGADLGQRSDSWQFQSPFGPVILSVDQAFPGWHELTVCYRNAGWQLQSRVADSVTNSDWPLVVGKFTNGAGQHGFLVFCFFDEAGNPLQAPGQWNTWTALRERVKNRMSPTVRGALFSLAAYQVQTFVPTASELSATEQQEVVQNFLVAREAVRREALGKK